MKRRVGSTSNSDQHLDGLPLGEKPQTTRLRPARMRARRLLDTASDENRAPGRAGVCDRRVRVGGPLDRATSSAGKARNPVRRPPGRERTPRASAQARDTDRVAGIAEGRPNGRPAQRPAHPAGRGFRERSRSSKACCVTSVADINRGVQPRTVANPRSMDEPTDPSGRVVREGGAHAYGQGAWRLLQAVDGCSLDRTCEPSLAVPTRGRSETLRPHR